MTKKTRSLSIIVDNEPGVLARVVGMFSAQGYNIDSLHVEPSNKDKTESEILLTTTVEDAVCETIIKKLEKIVPVHKVREK